MTQYKNLRLKVKDPNLYAPFWNICDFQLKLEDFLKIITFELRKIEMSRFLHFEAQISNFLKM